MLYSFDINLQKITCYIDRNLDPSEGSSDRVWTCQPEKRRNKIYPDAKTFFWFNSWDASCK